MKYLKCILVILLAVLLLTGCTEDLFTTAEYRAYKAFAEKHTPGMEKEEILQKLGDPDSRRREVWVYECYELPDPANPCRLTILFDGEGKSTDATFVFVPGG